MQHNEYYPGMPNPGSFKAFRVGCKCDMLSNQFGIGSDLSGMSRHWFVSDDCPIHNDAVKLQWDRIRTA